MASTLSRVDAGTTSGEKFTRHEHEDDAVRQPQREVVLEYLRIEIVANIAMSTVHEMMV